VDNAVVVLFFDERYADQSIEGDAVREPGCEQHERTELRKYFAHGREVPRDTSIRSPGSNALTAGPT
jgi:hypothetical protein